MVFNAKMQRRRDGAERKKKRVMESREEIALHNEL